MSDYRASVPMDRLASRIAIAVAGWMSDENRASYQLAIAAVLKASESKEEHVAWCKYTKWGDGRVTIRTCDSDAEGAFKVYR